MADRINGGGPAFPNPALAEEGYRSLPGDGGMSLRDWFAGKALMGLMAFPGKIDNACDKNIFAMARISYEAADAMLAARNGEAAQ